MNNIYVLLDEMRTSIISMDLSYSRTTELLNQILEIEKALDRVEYWEEQKEKGGAE